MIAHELAHIKHRDILIQSVAATIGAAITYIGYMLMWFGATTTLRSAWSAALAMVLLAPLAASIIQLAVSRQREYAADAGAPRSAATRSPWPAHCCGWSRVPRRSRWGR